MGKFTLEDITKLVNEELEKFTTKQALISEKAELEAELKALNEVHAGGEIESDKEYHEGQKEAEFETKGTHIVEEEMEEELEEMENDFDNSMMEEEGAEDSEFDEVQFEDPIPDMAGPVKIPGGGSMDDEEAVKADLPTWMMGEETEMDEEVDMDAKIKEDLEEMMEPEMAQEIAETISEENEDGEEDETPTFNPSDYSGLGESEEMSEDMAAGAGNDFAEGEEVKEENLYESVIDKRRKNIMSESMLKRMRVLSGQDKRWDKE